MSIIYERMRKMKNETMKGRILFGIIAMSILVSLGGCGPTLPPAPIPSGDNWIPLTVPLLRSILNRNNGDWEEALKELDIRLSVGIFLERPFTESDIYVSEGAVHYTYVDRPNTLTIYPYPDEKGYGMGKYGRSDDSGKYFLYVCFDEENLDLTLSFSNFGDHRDEKIYLDYYPIENRRGDEKGRVTYGTVGPSGPVGPSYNLSFSGNSTPYLLINFKVRSDQTRDERILYGPRYRRVRGEREEQVR